MTPFRVLDAYPDNPDKAESKERENDQVEFIEIGTSATGVRIGIVALYDLDKKGRVYLPLRITDQNKAGIEQKLQLMGYEGQVSKWNVNKMDAKDILYLKQALNIMPPILAVAACFQFENRPDLGPYLDIGREMVPVIGLEAPPHSGKTMGLIVAMLVYPGRVMGWDWDPFSDQSLTACLEKVKSALVTKGIDPMKSLRGVIPEIERVYQEQKAFENKKWVFRQIIQDSLVDYLANSGGKLAILADLPGEDDNMEFYNLAHFIRHTLPTMDLTREMVREGKRTNIPLTEHYSDDFSSPAYSYVLHNTIRAHLGLFNRGGSEIRGNEAISRARTEWREFQEVLDVQGK